MVGPHLFSTQLQANQHFLPCQQYFNIFKQSKTEIIILAIFIFSSAHFISLFKKCFQFCEGLHFMVCHKINVTQMITSLFDTAENIEGNGGMLPTSIFLFSDNLSSGELKLGIVQ